MLLILLLIRGNIESTYKDGLFSTDIFASEPAGRFICAICHDVLKDACALNCGHTFCGGVLIHIVQVVAIRRVLTAAFW